MASISKSNNSVIIQCDNASNPSVISNWQDGEVTYSDDFVQLTFGNKGFKFGVWDITPMGELVTVNGVDVSAMSNADICELIRNNVLTEDQFSGTPVLIDDTNMVAGQFTAIQFIEDTILDVSDSAATIEVDGNGTTIDMTPYSGVSFAAGSQPLYGKFTQVQLISGTVKCYSNL